MLQQALQKLQQEMGAAPKVQFVQIVGGFLQAHIRNNPDHAALVMDEGKTIVGSVKAMEDVAKKNQSNNRYAMTDEEGFAIVLRYYGVHVPEAAPEVIPVELPKITVSLDDWL